MKKYLFASAILLSVCVIAKAALPALVLPVIVEAVEALAIRSAGRQIIAELGTAAANDTTFAAAVNLVRGSQIAGWLGIGAVTAAWPVNTDKPIAPTLAADRYAIQIGPLNDSNAYKPAKISPGYELRVWSQSSHSYKYVYGKTREEAINNWIAKAATNY